MLYCDCGNISLVLKPTIEEQAEIVYSKTLYKNITLEKIQIRYSFLSNTTRDEEFDSIISCAYCKNSVLFKSNDNSYIPLDLAVIFSFTHSSIDLNQ